MELRDEAGGAEDGPADRILEGGIERSRRDGEIGGLRSPGDEGFAVRIQGDRVDAIVRGAPRNGEYSREFPAAFSLVTNPSMPPLAKDVRNGPGVVGKSLEFVYPATYASPAPSTAIANPRSLFEPPRNVEYTGAVPEGFNYTTTASQVTAPPIDVRYAPGAVGKSGDIV